MNTNNYSISSPFESITQNEHPKYVYFIDSEGLIRDSDGFYLADGNGNPIRLTNEQIGKLKNYMQSSIKQ